MIELEEHLKTDGHTSVGRENVTNERMIELSGWFKILLKMGTLIAVDESFNERRSS
ncbi:hypothetical protein [Anoxynatronum sibiricum]|uniref:hypothetical protein n=1 Tax=Anoxynatronum sibiricum TaxID=210623 RepID=UPI0031B82ECC